VGYEFDAAYPLPVARCYDCFVFQFGRPKTAGQWIGHIVGAIIALFLVWWMLRVFVF
jgi:hypothetical protein